MRRSIKEKLFYYSQPLLYSKKIKELEDTEERVIWLLEKYQHLRNCDKCLIKSFHVKNDNYKGELDSNIIHGLTPEESITRCRRKIQNVLGLYLPTSPDVIKARGIFKESVKEWGLNK